MCGAKNAQTLSEQHTVSALPVIPDSFFQWFPAASHFPAQTVKAEKMGCGTIH